MGKSSSAMGRTVCWVAMLLLACLLNLAWAGDFGTTTGAAFVPRRHRPLATHLPCVHVRGGASRAAAYDEDEDEDDDEEIVGKVIEEIEREDDEEEDEVDPKLTVSAMKSAAKAKAKVQSQKNARVKKAVNSKLSDSKPVAKASKKTSSMFQLPYIFKAFLNPFTVLAMTKSYWVSLFNLDYPPKDTNQDLRSSIEEKNRNAGPAAFKKPKRKFKRGQAKTLSDLPQLNT